ncbi:class I SAM-dependent methyltransferase [Pararhodospirillum photometricum]|nr:methyltransferase domain-containing protein [Pararhodospirillum photometricum]
MSLVESFVDTVARRPGGVIGRLLYRHPVGHEVGFRRALAAVPVGPGDRVLEVGCGAGVFLKRVLAQGATALGVDHSSDMLAETVRANALAVATKRLTVEQADAAHLPVADASVERVFCFNAFFFFPEPEAALAEMARALRPGGRLALVTAADSGQGWMAWAFGPVVTRMRFYTPDSLAALARTAGLSVDTVIPLPGDSLLLLAHK